MSTPRFYTCGVAQGWQSALDWAVGSCEHGRSLTERSARREGARLESEACEQHGATAKRLNAHAISDLAFQNDQSVRVGKPRCS
jgi:hypothetical protein